MRKPVGRHDMRSLNQSLQQFTRQKKMQEDVSESFTPARKYAQRTEETTGSKPKPATHQTQIHSIKSTRLLTARKNEQAEMELLLSRADEITKGYAEWKETRTSLEAMDALAVRFHDLREKRTTPFLAIEKTRNSLEQEQKSLDEKRTLIEAIQKELPGRKAALEQDQQAITRLVEQIDRKPDFENQLVRTAVAEGRPLGGE